MPVRTEATFRIVTPMFLGGADLKPVDHIPAPSIKGALRFWWRAMNWPLIRAGTDSVQKALAELHGQEARLFGLAADSRGGGQGQFLLAVKPAKKFAVVEESTTHRFLKGAPGARYLGYGLVKPFGTAMGQLMRGCIDETSGEQPGIFTVQLLSRHKLDGSILDALKAFGLFGALGRRARHGFGSVSLQSLQVTGGDEKSGAKDPPWSPPKDEQSYMGAVRELMEKCLIGDESPPFSAFSAKSRIDLLHNARDAYKVLDFFGKEMLTYRSWGQTFPGGNRLASGVESEKNFKPDHDWYREPGYRRRNPQFHPRRIIFGLPHNYSKEDADHVTAEGYERRASPLIFHVHKAGDAYLGVSLTLPGDFLPAGVRIMAGKAAVPARPDWPLLTEFLDGESKTRKTARFPDKKTIRKREQP